VLGEVNTLEEIIDRICESKENWLAICKFAENVMKEKEEDERKGKTRRKRKKEKRKMTIVITSYGEQFGTVQRIVVSNARCVSRTRPAVVGSTNDFVEEKRNQEER